MTIRSLMIAATLGIAVTLPAAAWPAPEWELLGSRRVSFRAERDVVEVGAGDGRFTAIRLEVDGGTMELYDVRIVFGNGESWSPATRLVFNEGSRSRTLDLPRGARGIDRVEFRYRSQSRRGRAMVQVYGLTAPPERIRPTSITGAEAHGWDHIGSRRVSRWGDHDVINAGSQGAFRRVLIEVDGAAVEMWDVVITFANGQTYSPPTRLVFNANTRSRVIDVPGRSRIISRVDFRYRSLDRRGRNGAAVSLFGRR